jgi:hypothetical protein
MDLTPFERYMYRTCMIRDLYESQVPYDSEDLGPRTAKKNVFHQLIPSRHNLRIGDEAAFASNTSYTN